MRCLSAAHSNSNSGEDQENVNYNRRQDILRKIDYELLGTINIKPHSEIFQCKTNSLHGDMSELVGYGGTKKSQSLYSEGLRRKMK